MIKYHPMRQLPSLDHYKQGDVVVIFGELFQRGYVNGVIDAAQTKGMKVIYSTMGRRTDEEVLRPLTDLELNSAPNPIINIPLEAGFDLEPSTRGLSPVEQLAPYKLQDWDQVELDWKQIEESYTFGTERFKTSLQAYIDELGSHIDSGSHVLFVHTMAGGIPRSKLLLAIMNRVFKGKGNRGISSEIFWRSQLGQLCNKSFNAVTAETFQHLIDESKRLRQKIESTGGSIRYIAYGYHGCEALIDGEYRWMTYVPYLQGEAKLLLEEIAQKAWESGVKATVYNCPEILTNSSSIFQGVELSLYMLLAALKKEGPEHNITKTAWEKTASILKPEFSIEDILAVTKEFALDPRIQKLIKFETWPQHSNPEQLEFMLEESRKLQDRHRDSQLLAIFHLSELVFESTGRLMLTDSWQPSAPIWWLNHDIIAKELTQ